jgi:hypothetical protein
MLGAGRVLLRVLALLVLSFSLPIVVLAAVDAVREPDVDGSVVCVNCGPTTAPIAIFTGRVQARAGSNVTFHIDSLERGTWDTGAPIQAVGAEFAPWRRYRVEVYARDNTAYVSAFAPARTLSLAVPVGLRSFNGLPMYDWLAVALAPLLVLSIVVLVAGARSQSRRERSGIYAKGVGPVPRKPRRRGRPRPSPELSRSG